MANVGGGIGRHPLPRVAQLYVARYEDVMVLLLEEGVVATFSLLSLFEELKRLLTRPLMPSCC